MLLLPLLACTPPDDTKPADTAGADDTGAPAGPLALAPGDVADLDVADDGTVSGELANDGTYIVLLYSAAVLQGSTFGYGDNAAADAVIEPGDAAPPPHDVGPTPSYAAVGDTRLFQVWNGSETVTIEAIATQVSDGVVVWEDQTTPNEIGAVDEETLSGVIANFQDIIVPRERQVFGEESDVDGGGSIDFLLSYTVNQSGPVAYVSWCDIGAEGGCDGSGNGSEIIYVGIPDPSSNYSSVDGISETVAHELNHLIYAWHKYVENDQPDASENVYLTEGMSALAQDLTGYNNGNQYVWGTALDGVSVYHDEDASIQGVSINDFLRGDGYYDEDRDGPLRGGAYLFLRYLFEQAGGFTVESDGTLVDAGGMDFLHSWFDSAELGPDCVTATTGRDVDDVALDWYTALVVTGRVENDNPAWSYQDQVQDPLTGYMFGIDPFTTIHGWWTLTGPRVQALDEADGSIRGGGVEYLQADLTAGVFTLATAPEAKIRARILRVE
jgi:hypothetical protein